jgi:GT2 family glycosyltransferase
MPTQSRVLMVIPTLGQRPELLRQTLESVVAQVPLPPDIILVCPRDNEVCVKLAKEFGAKLADDPGGLSAAVNVGMEQAEPQHEFLAWFGDDDLLRPGATQSALEAIDAHPQAVVAYGYCDYVDDDGRQIFTSRAGKLAPWIMTWGPNLVPLPGLLFRLSAVRKVGPFDPNLKYAMDLDMLLRLRKQGPFVKVPRVLGAFRWHSSSTTVAQRTKSLAEAQAVKRRYLSPAGKKLAPVWEAPVRLATQLVSRRVSSKAKKQAGHA